MDWTASKFWINWMTSKFRIDGIVSKLWMDQMASKFWMDRNGRVPGCFDMLKVVLTHQWLDRSYGEVFGWIAPCCTHTREFCHQGCFSMFLRCFQCSFDGSTQSDELRVVSNNLFRTYQGIPSPWWTYRQFFQCSLDLLWCLQCSSGVFNVL